MKLNCDVEPIHLKGFKLENETLEENSYGNHFNLLSIQKLGLIDQLNNFRMDSSYLNPSMEGIRLVNNFEQIWLIENTNGDVSVFYLNNTGLQSYKLCLNNNLKQNRSQSVNDFEQPMTEEQIKTRHTY